MRWPKPHQLASVSTKRVGCGRAIPGSRRFWWPNDIISRRSGMCVFVTDNRGLHRISALLMRGMGGPDDRTPYLNILPVEYKTMPIHLEEDEWKWLEGSFVVENIYYMVASLPWFL